MSSFDLIGGLWWDEIVNVDGFSVFCSKCLIDFGSFGLEDNVVGKVVLVMSNMGIGSM